MVKVIIIALIIGIIIGFITVSAMKAGLTSVAPERQANNYMRQGSLKIRISNERFTRKHVDKTARNNN